MIQISAIGRPRGKTKLKVNFTISTETYADAKVAALALGRSLSAEVNALLEEWLAGAEVATVAAAISANRKIRATRSNVKGKGSK